jgi:hypothetical protein
MDLEMIPVTFMQEVKKLEVEGLMQQYIMPLQKLYSVQPRNVLTH